MRQFYTIEDWLDYTIEHTSYNSFYPSAIKKQVENATDEKIVLTCLKYIESNKLSLMYEVRCPECFNVLGTYETFGNIPDEIEYCESCREEDIECLDNCIILYKISR